jgi:hypothetical protein
VASRALAASRPPTNADLGVVADLCVLSWGSPDPHVSRISVLSWGSLEPHTSALRAVIRRMQYSVAVLWRLHVRFD